MMAELNRRDFVLRSVAGTVLGAGIGRADDSVCEESGPRPDFDPELTVDPDTLFLTWQRDPTTTMTVQWVGPPHELEDPVVWVAPSAKDQWQSVRGNRQPFPMTDLFLYRVELTGLRPGSEYRFHVGIHSPEYRFRTAPATADAPVTFVSGGDSGVTAAAVKTNIQAARQDPLFGLIGGDICYGNGKTPKAELQFLRNWRKHMVTSDGCLIPLLVCIGNHEVDGGYGKTRKEAPFFYCLFGLFQEQGYAVLDFGDYMSLVLLDSGHTSPVPGAQTNWLEQTLAGRPHVPHLFAFQHVPAYPSYREFKVGAEARTHWVPLFERYSVGTVFEHHDHTYKRTKPLLRGQPHPEGIVYIGDGGWGMLRAPKKLEDCPFLAVSMKSHNYILTRLTRSDRIHMALDNAGKVIDVHPAAARV